MFNVQLKLLNQVKVVKESLEIKKGSKKVPGVGLEPTRPNGHMALNHACLPIPAPGRGEPKRFCKDTPLRLYYWKKKVKHRA